MVIVAKICGVAWVIEYKRGFLLVFGICLHVENGHKRTGRMTEGIGRYDGCHISDTNSNMYYQNRGPNCKHKV